MARIVLTNEIARHQAANDPNVNWAIAVALRELFDSDESSVNLRVLDERVVRLIGMHPLHTTFPYLEHNVRWLANLFPAGTCVIEYEREEDIYSSIPERQETTVFRFFPVVKTAADAKVATATPKK